MYSFWYMYIQYQSNNDFKNNKNFGEVRCVTNNIFRDRVRSGITLICICSKTIVLSIICDYFFGFLYTFVCVFICLPICWVSTITITTTKKLSFNFCEGTTTGTWDEVWVACRRLSSMYELCNFFLLPFCLVFVNWASVVFIHEYGVVIHALIKYFLGYLYVVGYWFGNVFKGEEKTFFLYWVSNC